MKNTKDSLRSRLLWNASWLRAALEAAGAFLLLFFLLLLLQPSASLWTLGLLLIALACASWCALRIHPPEGEWRSRLLEEAGVFLALSVIITSGVCIPVYGLELVRAVNLDGFKVINLGLTVFTVLCGLLYALMRIGIGLAALVENAATGRSGFSLFRRAVPWRAWLEAVLASLAFFFFLLPLLTVDSGNSSVWPLSLLIGFVLCAAWFAFRTRLPAGAWWKILLHELALAAAVNAVFYTGACLPLVLLGWVARPGMWYFFPPSGGPVLYALIISIAFILSRVWVWLAFLLETIGIRDDPGSPLTGIRRSQSRFFVFFQTGFGRSILESAAGTFFLSLAVLMADPIQNSNIGLFLIPGGFALWCALRIRLSSGPWQRRLLLEAGYALVGGGILGGMLDAALLLVNILFPADGSGQVPVNTDTSSLPLEIFIVMGVMVVVFGILRAVISLSDSWRRLQRRSMVLSLTNAIISTVLAGLFIFSCFIIIPTVLTTDSPEWPSIQSNVISWAFIHLMNVVFPMVGGAVILIFLAVVLVLPPAMLFSYWVARNHAKRIRELVQATDAMRGGNYSIQVPVKGEDEVARLQSDFNAMAADLDRTVRDLQTERDRVAGILQSRRELIAGVSHELRTPVATIRAHLELARRKRSVSSLSAELNILDRETVRLQGLINDLFTLSQAEVNKLTLNLKAEDAGEIVRQRAAAMAPLAWQSGRVQVSAEVAPGIPPVIADRMRLEQVLTNLIHNAARHTPPGGVVLVGVSSEEDAVRIDVRDSGEGIAPKDLPNVWIRYYQGKGAAKSPGSGLGLALVKEFAEAMGGSVAVKSEVGKGSCFSLRLKRAAER